MARPQCGPHGFPHAERLLFLGLQDSKIHRRIPCRISLMDYLTRAASTISAWLLTLRGWQRYLLPQDPCRRSRQIPLTKRALARADRRRALLDPCYFRTITSYVYLVINHSSQAVPSPDFKTQRSLICNSTTRPVHSVTITVKHGVLCAQPSRR